MRGLFNNKHTGMASKKDWYYQLILVCQLVQEYKDEDPRMQF